MQIVIWLIVAQLLAGWCAYFVGKAKRLDPITCYAVATTLPLLRSFVS